MSDISNNHGLFSKERLFNYVKDFSFPRLNGTEGEKKAVDLTIKTFKDIGFKDKIQKEDFEFSDFYSTTLFQLIAILSLTATLILALIIYIHYYIAIITIGGMSIVVYFILKGLKHPEKKNFWGEYFGKTIEGSNVFVKIPAKLKSEHEAGNIIISAHLDSKSQTIKTAWRVVAYRILLYGGLLLGVVYIILLTYQIFRFFPAFFLNQLVFIEKNIMFLLISLWILTALVSSSNIILLFLYTDNKSPGALDNASGMSVVFELASYFRKENLVNNYNLWFCQFSAEELGTMGSRVFVNNYEDQFVKGKIFQINLDMISIANHRGNRLEYLKTYGVFLRKKIAPVLGMYLEKAAKIEDLKIHGYHLSTGAHTDCVPFHLRGFDAVVLNTKSAALYTHSKTDTPDKVDPQILLEACIVVRKVILMLDKDYKS